MPSNIIQWFPGHMAKTRRLIGENLPKVDIIIELLDEAKKLLPEADVEKLTTEQSDWEADMAAAVETAGKEFEGGSMYALIVNAEAAKLTEERVYKLYELLR